MNWLLVTLGAGVGAPLRYVVDQQVTRVLGRRGGSRFPFGTLAANLGGCGVLGLLTGIAFTHPDLPVSVSALVGTGFCGALSTYSTFGLETVRLARTGDRLLAAATALISVTAGLGATALGYLLAWSLTG